MGLPDGYDLCGGPPARAVPTATEKRHVISQPSEVWKPLFTLASFDDRMRNLAIQNTMIRIHTNYRGGGIGRFTFGQSPHRSNSICSPEGSNIGDAFNT